MKQMRCILCLAVLACFMCSGCKVIYQQFIQGEWEVDRYYKNGNDQTNYYTLTYDNYKIKFYKEGDFTETYTLIVLPVTVSGTWEIERKPDGKVGEFQLKLTSEKNVRIYDIKEISKETIDISRTIDSDNTERIILEPVPAS